MTFEVGEFGPGTRFVVLHRASRIRVAGTCRVGDTGCGWVACALARIMFLALFAFIQVVTGGRVWSRGGWHMDASSDPTAILSPSKGRGWFRVVGLFAMGTSHPTPLT